MNRNHIIFFWILCLILFTFYCVFRLKYLSDTSYKNKDTHKDTDRNTDINTDINTDKTIQEKYNDVPSLTAYTGDVLVTIAAKTTAPAPTKISDFITYIENIQDDKLSDMLNCGYLYDDNLKVRDLGYKNCGDAYADYLDKNYDVNKKYSDNYTLAEICPIASKSPTYQKCLQLLLTKFTDGVNLIGSVNTDMNNSINSRLSARTDNLHKIQESINPFIYNKVQNDFNKTLIKTGQFKYRTDDKLNLVNKHYQDRYQDGIETFTNTNTNNNTVEPFTNVILPDIEKLFFGKYQPVRGQFTNLADLTFTIEYDDSGNDMELNLEQSQTSPKEPEPTQTSPKEPSQTSQTTSDFQSKTQLSELSPLSVKSNARPVIFTLRNNDIYITYKVSKIDFYKLNKQIIKLILTRKNIVYQSSPTNIVEPLLKELGLYSPSSIILVFDPYTSTEKQNHDTYKLVNDNLDTILVLDKLRSPKTTKSTATPTNSL